MASPKHTLAGELTAQRGPAGGPSGTTCAYRDGRKIWGTMVVEIRDM